MNKFNPVKYKNDFAKQNYDRIALNIPKGKGLIIKEYAKQHGFKSVNNFIWECIQTCMENNMKSIHAGNISQNDDGNSIDIH